jgi:hypothetical protein
LPFVGRAFLPISLRRKVFEALAARCLTTEYSQPGWARRAEVHLASLRNNALPPFAHQNWVRFFKTAIPITEQPKPEKLASFRKSPLSALRQPIWFRKKRLFFAFRPT